MTDIHQLCREAKALADRNDLFAAREKCAEALALDSSNGETLHLFGQIEFELNFLDHAEQLLRKAVQAKPEEALYLYSLGRALYALSRRFEARNAFARAVSLKPDFAGAWAELALTMLSLQEPAHEVERAAYTALRLHSGLPAALRALIELRRLQGRTRDYAALLEQLAAQKPADEIALLAGAGLALAKEQEFDQAAALLDRAARLVPDDGEFAKALAECLGEAGYPAKAKKVFAQAATKANGKDIWHYKHLGYCPEFFASSAEVDAYWNWLNAELDAALERRPVFDFASLAAAGFSASFHITHLWRDPLPVLQKMAELFAPSFPIERPEPTQRPQKTGRIRLGFFIAPGHETTFIRSNAPLVMGLNSERFERVLFYPAGAGHLFAGFVDRHIAHAPYRGSFVEAANSVRNAGCDIVYHWKAGENFWTLYAPLMRLAPVQCTSWGTHGSSGIAAIDYNISWDLAETAEAGERQYTEKLFRLPCPPLIQQPLPAKKTKPSKADLGLPGTGTLYFCPHRLAKYHPEFDFYLKTILEEDADAHVLVLLHGPQPAKEQLRRRMSTTVGPKTAARLLFLPKCTPERYGDIMNAADIMLSSPSYDSSLSGFDALARGCPMVSQVGPLQINRYGAAFYWSMRIEDAPLASDRQSYVQAALALSRDTERRHALSKQLRERSALFSDAQGIIREWERFFEEAVR